MLFRYSGRFLMVWQGRGAIPDTQWSSLMSALAEHPGVPLKAFVVSRGGAPSPTQQLAIARVTTRRACTVAVLSESVGVRFVVSSVALLVKRIQVFSPTDVRAACAFLDLAPSEALAAEAFVDELRGRPSDALSLD